MVPKSRIFRQVRGGIPQELKTPSRHTRMVLARVKILASKRGWCGNADCGNCPLRPGSCQFDERTLPKEMVFDATRFVDREWQTN